MPCNFVADGFHTKKLCSRLFSSDHTAMQTIGHSSIDITAVMEYVIHSGPEVLFKTCVAMKFVDDDDDDDDDDDFTRKTAILRF